MTRTAPLEVDALDDNARLLAGAFDVDPAYRYLFPVAQTRFDGLTDFFARNQRVHLPLRSTYVMRNVPDGPPLATVTLRAPRSITISTITMLRHGLLPFARRHGYGAVRRLLWLKDTYDALEQEAAEGQPHFYVHMMAVAKRAQGQGLGSELLRAVLEPALRGRSAPTVLTTHLPENLMFYRRAGFEVLSERTLSPPGGAPYTVWSMRR